MDYFIILIKRFFSYSVRMAQGTLILNESGLILEYKSKLDLILALLFYVVVVQALYYILKLTQAIFPTIGSSLILLAGITIFSFFTFYIYIKKFYNPSRKFIPSDEILKASAFEAEKEESSERMLEGIELTTKNESMLLIPFKNNQIGLLENAAQELLNSIKKLKKV